MSTPINPDVKLGNEEDRLIIDKEMHQRLVGNLIYLSHTRFDTTWFLV